MEQLKMWADNGCMYSRSRQAQLSASGFQGAGRPSFSQSCARPISGMTCGARSLLTLGEISKQETQETCGRKTRILTIVEPGQ